jgi:pyruvate/2-oxoglutarate/acetoin dehydrogenase E1 component/TPP-dependent pyruvate/acetoin dehydrogenase alpha subunit
VISGRDTTETKHLMMAIGELTVEQFFAGLYAHTDIEYDPMSAGRQMGGHFGTHSLDDNYNWKNLTEQYNSSSDISPTAAQMPRLLGLAQASKIFRHLSIPNSNNFSTNGNEVAWGTIGNASTSEGLFFETINAAGVLQVPMVVSVWDDEYGISVHAKHQTTKENISEVLKGFQRDENHEGFEIFVVNGWDYSALIDTYQQAADIARKEHVPVIIHVKQLTQPQGHSTSGSHERYKTPERLAWEKEYDCNAKMREWIISNGIASQEEIINIDKAIKRQVRQQKTKSWNNFLESILHEREELVNLLTIVSKKSVNGTFIKKLINDLKSLDEPLRNDVISTARKSLRYLINEHFIEKEHLQNWVNNFFKTYQPKFSSHLYSESPKRATAIKEVLPTYSDNAKLVDGRIILRDNFDQLFSKHQNTLVFGEDTGQIGDVNQGLEGLQEKYGELRVSDTGIREATILGQGIGLAMRGLRPIAEIQYLDYLMYALQIISDDLATLHYRTVGKQNAPLIIRTRGHRLEGIWHSGSQLGGIINLVRGVHVLVPRNMTKAAGFYNTYIESDQPALIVECLNGYRLKERMPSNIGEFKTPAGEIEVLKEGTDLTLVSYGSTLRIVQKAANELLEVGINVEVIDAQSLLPFDIKHNVVQSVKKTNRLMIIDEDVPGGASAYLLDQIINKQNGYEYLDSPPITLTAKSHRPAYGTDGDYFSKPSREDVFEEVYQVMHEVNPKKYPKLR